MVYLGLLPASSRDYRRGRIAQNFHYKGEWHVSERVGNLMSLPVSRMFFHILFGIGGRVARLVDRLPMRPNTGLVSVCPRVVREKSLSQIRVPIA